MENSLAVKPTVQTRLVLAKVYDHAGRPDAAQEQRRIAIGSITGDA